jgi:quercetin dioxygenase-like cupin family protein
MIARSIADLLQSGHTSSEPCAGRKVHGAAAALIRTVQPMHTPFIERIRHPDPAGAGYAQQEQDIRAARAQGGIEFAIEPGKRAEIRVPPGERPVVHVLEGAVRFEGDDTAATAGDVVWFCAATERGILGIQADVPARGVVVLERRAAP